jgi:hypothetical protein
VNIKQRKHIANVTGQNMKLDAKFIRQRMKHCANLATFGRGYFRQVR